MSSRWFQIHLIRPVQPLLRSKWARPNAAIPVLLFLMPVAALAQGGSPFDTGFTAIQSLFTGTIAKVANVISQTRSHCRRSAFMGLMATARIIESDVESHGGFKVR
jgi:hypothetical protein